MLSSKSVLITSSIAGKVNLVPISELLHHAFDVGHSPGSSSHGLGGVVGVASGSIPVWEKFWGVGDVNLEVFCDTVEDVARHVQLVANGNSMAWSDLVLPLSWHDLSVGSRDLDTSIEAGSIMCVTNDSSEASAGTCRTVVRSLLSWITIVWPSKRPGGELGGCSEHCVLLLDTEPWLLILASLEDSTGMGSEVGFGWGEFLARGISPSVRLAEDEEMVMVRVLGWSSEWVLEDGNWLHDDLRVLSLGQVTGGSIVVPVWEVVDSDCSVLRHSSEGLALGTKVSLSVDPDVLGNNILKLTSTNHLVLVVE